jgi:16S rRNA G527 N7-methylase RsmG
VIDVGTGAGFPGLALKIYRPGLKVHFAGFALTKRLNFPGKRDSKIWG